MRTNKVIKGSIIEIIPTLIIAALGFIRTKVFISFLGSELNGYYQFIVQFVSYLFLAEAGFGTAISYKLYKPIANKDEKKISEIYKGSIKIFRRIGLLISGLVIILAFLMNYIIKSTISVRIIVILSFILISLSNIISFFFYSRAYQSLYNANQEKYIASTISNFIKILSEIIEIVATIYFRSLIAIAISMFLCKVFEEILFIIISKKRFKYLKITKDTKEDLTASKMTSELIFNQIGYTVFNNIDTVVLMTFSVQGAIGVSIYTAYYYIHRFIINIIAKISTTILHVLGNVYATENTEKSKKVFDEYIIFTIITSIICGLLYYYGSRAFVNIWINKSEYIISNFCVSLFSLVLLLAILMEPLINVIAANGLFKKSKYFTLISSIVNLTLSIILARKYGINGVLIATCIGYLLDIAFRSILISKNLYAETKKCAIFIKYFLVLIGIIGIIYITNPIENLFLKNINSYLSFFLFMSIAAIAIIIITTTIFLVISTNARNLYKRCIKLIRK